MPKKQRGPIIILIVVVVVIIGAILIWNSNKTANKNDASKDATSIVDNNVVASSTLNEEGGGGITGTGAGIVVDDQNPGRVVTVNQVSLTKPGWVIIKEAVNGKPGSIIGARLFGQGKNSGLIELLRPMVIGRSYYAVVYNDDGDQKYDPKKDLVLKGTNGADIMVLFAVTKATDTQ
jgi:hypothetical protein